MRKHSIENIIDLNRASYDLIAPEFSSTRGYSWQDVDYLFKFVKPSDKILDVGCGNGRLLQQTTNYHLQPTNYFGIDFSEKLIEEARQLHPGFRFEIRDISDRVTCSMCHESGRLLHDARCVIHDLCDSNTFDAVFMISVLNHFPKELHDQVLQDVKKCLKSGGKLLMINWNLWNARNNKSIWHQWPLSRNMMTKWGNDRVPLYYYSFTKGELRRLLIKNGFIVEENFYSKRGKKSSWLFGANIVTVCIAG
ncbi:MAG: class I SAM-dependent methyltransferase [Parcubacteria group bacterium]